jgi:hypothetical protein
MGFKMKLSIVLLFVILATSGCNWPGTAQDSSIPDSDRPNASLTPSPVSCQASVIEQSFEHGFMFWLGRTQDERCKAEHTFEQGSGVIWVAIANTNKNHGDWIIVPDEWDPAFHPESDPTLVAPEGLYQPVRGFGYAWRALPTASREALGWATGGELPFNTNYQYLPGGFYDLSGDFVIRPGKHKFQGLAGDMFVFDELSQTVTYASPN